MLYEVRYAIRTMMPTKERRVLLDAKSEVEAQRIFWELAGEQLRKHLPHIKIILVREFYT